MSDVRAAARNLLDAFGGDTPDWLREEASALETALLTTSPGEALLAELRAPIAGYDSFVEDFDYAAALHRIVEKARDVGMRPVQPHRREGNFTHASRIFVDDGKPKVAGQLPHETYAQAQDRRSSYLLGTQGHALGFDEDGNFWSAPQQGFSGGIISIRDELEEQAVAHGWRVVLRQSDLGYIQVQR